MIKEHTQAVVLLTGIADLVITVAAWVLAWWIRFHSGWVDYHGEIPSLVSIADVIVITLLLTLLVFGRMGIYQPRRGQPLWLETLDLLKACAIVWAGEVFMGHFLHYPRLSVKMQGLLLVIWPMMLITFRLGVRSVLRTLRARGRNTRAVAIVGAGRVGQTLFHRLRKLPWTGYNIVYFVDEARAGETLLGVPVRGGFERVGEIVQKHPVDVVFIALPQRHQDRLEEVLSQLGPNLVDVNVVPDLLSFQFLRHRITQIGRLPVVNLTFSPQTGWNSIVKRLIDVVLSALAVILLLPLGALIALFVKLTSPGPVVYRQRRASLGGEEFDILKFRSMTVDAEDEDGPNWHVETDDPRVTWFGRILRKTSLDELPQLINVLRGDMSLVGPRPERPEFIERFRRQIPGYMLRHHVKAGLTGWAQVNGFRGATSLRKRIQYDLDYINRWSLGFDLYIMVLTVFRGMINPSP
jgi:putative colanic acid biosynthesis UDP-glucose lipid carrier transferase